MAMSEEFNYQRPLAAGILAAIAFSILAAIVYMLFALVGTYFVGHYFLDGRGMQFLLIFGLLALAILSAIGIYFFIKSRYGNSEAILATIIFVGFTLVLAPIVIFLFGMIITIFMSNSMALID
jgi:hypothetical protein